MERIFHALLTAVLACMMGLAAPVGASCAEKEKMSNAITFPPEVAGWRWDGIEGHYDTRTVYNYIDGAAELYLAYNLRQVIVRRYENAAGSPIVADVYEMGSPKDAFGVFSFEQQDPDVGIGQGSEYGGGLLRFWKGRYFVSVFGENPTPEVEAALLELGRKIAGAITESGKVPDLLDYLPQKEAKPVEKSVCFLRSHILLNQRFFISYKNILHLNNEVEAVLAQYATGQGKTHLLIVRYLSQAKANAAFESFNKAYMPEASKKGTVRTENGKWTKADQRGAFVIIAFDAPDEKRAEQLVRDTIERMEEKRL